MADPNLTSLSLLLLVPLSLFLILFLITRPKPTRIQIKNRHVLITGGSSGIGLALAHQFVTEGARVTILARNHAKLEDAKHSIKLSSGIDVTTLSADVRGFDSVETALDSVGPDIDILVCNHGVFVPNEIESQPLDEIKFMIDVNLIGTLNLIKAALPLFKRDRKSRGPGSIAIMSSQAENKKRPELTSIIAGSSGMMKADEVSKKAINGIKSGLFIVPCNLEGFLLSIATAGLSPQTSFLMAFVEVVGAGLLRMVGLFFQWNWYSSIEKWHSKVNSWSTVNAMVSLLRVRC